MDSRTKYELEKLELEQRIEDLEDIICPNGSHDDEEVCSYAGVSENVENAVKHIYKCKRCGNMYSKLTTEKNADK